MLSIDGVSYQYRSASTPALHEITLAIPEGSVFGLLGPAQEIDRLGDDRVGSRGDRAGELR